MVMVFFTHPRQISLITIPVELVFFFPFFAMIYSIPLEIYPWIMIIICHKGFLQSKTVKKENIAMVYRSEKVAIIR